MRMGLDIVQIVEAAERSLVYNGAPVQVIAGEGERRRLPDRRRNTAARPFTNEAPSSGLAVQVAPGSGAEDRGGDSAATVIDGEQAGNGVPANGHAVADEVPVAGGENGAPKVDAPATSS